MKVRKRFYVHSIQRKYALLTCLLLLTYTFVLAVALFLPPALKLGSSLPMEEQVVAAKQFVALSERLWPAILLSVPVFILMSFWFTHRFAGPVYRLEQSLKQIASGDLGMQVRFRTGDDLQELAALVNQIIRQEGNALRAVQDVHQRILQILGGVRSRSFSPEQVSQILEQIQVQIEDLESLLKQFKLGGIKSTFSPAERIPETIV